MGFRRNQLIVEQKGHETLANKQLTDHLVLTRGRNLIFDQEANDGYLYYLFEEANILSYSIGNITM